MKRKLQIMSTATAVATILTSLLLPLGSPVSFTDSSHQTPMMDQSAEATFLKVTFEDGSEQVVRNWECPDGLWAEDMHVARKAKCVCVKGVYAISTSLCDEDFKILTGDDHCFDTNGETIRKFIPLIGKSGFSGRASTVFRKDGPYFARLTSSAPTTSVGEPMHYVFRMNDPNDFSAYAKLGSGKAARLQCFPGQNVADDPAMSPVMQIAKLPNCSNEFRGPKKWCDEGSFTGDYQWSLSVGQSWSQRGGQVDRGTKYPGSCLPGGNVGAPKKAVGGGKGRKKRAAGGGTSKKGGKPVSRASSPSSSTSEEEPKCDKFEEASIEPEEYDTPTDHFFQVELLDPDQKFTSNSERQKWVNQQNKRVGMLLKQYYFGGDKGIIDAPRFQNFDEYKYVQLGKEILINICPTLSRHVLDFLLRTFRFLYIDSAKNYPYPIPPNEHENKRIVGALTACKDAAATAPIYFMGNKTCPSLAFTATNQSKILYIYNTNLTLPGNVAFNVSSMDVAIELVWKLTLLSHYYCSEQFASGFDHSLMFVKMEALLKNPIMQFRWYYPGQFNRMIQFFLLNNDLQKFAQTVDRCVITTFASSNFTVWLTRPAEMSSWEGKANKLNHPTGRTLHSATGNASPASKTTGAAAPDKQGKKGRKKRFYLQDDMWNKQAYCMHTTDAPYSEVRTGTFLSCRKPPVWFDNRD